MHATPKLCSLSFFFSFDLLSLFYSTLHTENSFISRSSNTKCQAGRRLCSCMLHQMDRGTFYFHRFEPAAMKRIGCTYSSLLKASCGIRLAIQVGAQLGRTRWNELTQLRLCATAKYTLNVLFQRNALSGYESHPPSARRSCLQSEHKVTSALFTLSPFTLTDTYARALLILVMRQGWEARGGRIPGCRTTGSQGWFGYPSRHMVRWHTLWDWTRMRIYQVNNSTADQHATWKDHRKGLGAPLGSNLRRTNLGLEP